MSSTPQEVALPQEEHAQEREAIGSARPAPLYVPAARITALLLLFTVAAVLECIYLTALGDYDVWFHLQTGDWILKNHAFPHSGIFSQYSLRPWMAYSWGFEALTALAYRAVGLMSLPLLLIAFKVALAGITFRMARITQHSFWSAVLLSAVAQLAIPNLETRPSFVSILFFGLELLLLFRSRRTGSMRPLYWLPPLFLVWANMHIQFVYGVIALAIFLAATVIEAVVRRWGWLRDERKAQALPAARVLAVVAGCLLATLVSPYSYHLYQIAWQYSHSTATYTFIAEMHAMNFRLPQHYLRLLLVMVAALALGYRRSRDLFAIALLASFAVLGFRAQRDVWIAVLPAIAILAESLASHNGAGEKTGTPTSWRWEKPLAAGLVAITLLIAVLIGLPRDRETLLNKVGEIFPVRACNAIRASHLQPPIYNPLNWGGFLIWYLPEYPVSNDGRTDLYGDEILTRQFQVMNGERSPLNESTFASAKTFLLAPKTALAWEMGRSPRYRLVYHDERAVVFVPVQ